MDEMAERLSRLALFADVPHPRLEAIAGRFEEEMFAPGQRILREGLSGTNLYVIVDGEVHVPVRGGETQRLGRGEFFGEVSALLDQPPTADVVATSTLRCLVVPQAELRGFLIENPEVSFRMLQAEAGRLAQTIGWLG
jgi:CRP-like cAMP-binding protein